MDLAKIKMPHNLDVERQVLGAMLMDEDAVHEAHGILGDADFYQPNHQKIYDALLELVANGTAIDLMTVTDLLEKNGTLKNLGGAIYIAELAQGIATSANIEYHAEIISEHAIRRKAIRNAAEQAQSATTEDVEVLAADAYQKAIDLIPKNRQGLRPISELADPVIERLERRMKDARDGRIGLKDIQTGFKAFDRRFGGFNQGEVIVLAARPSVGKTALMAQIAENVAEQGGKVLIFELEMNKLDIVERVMMGRSELSMQSSHIGKLTVADLRIVMQQANELQNLSIYIDDTPGITPSQINAKAERAKLELGQIDLICVDYLQIMESGNTAYRGGYESVTYCSQQMKRIARKLKTSLLLLSQFSRAPEREERIPRMADLRESGAIEQDADMILFLHRDSKVEPDQPGPRLWRIAKNRNGPTGDISVIFFPSKVRFGTATDEEEPFLNKADDSEVPF